MTKPHDPEIRELGQTRLTLRTDLRFTPRGKSDDPYYLVEDPLNSRFFRLGPTEYTFVSLLDGQTTLSEALSHLSTVMPDHSLSEVDAAGLCRWLLEMELAHSQTSRQAARLVRKAETQERRKKLARWNPLVCRIPLAGPDHWLGRFDRVLGWCFSPFMLPIWLGILITGGYHISADVDRFVSSSRGIFSPGNWLWLALAWTFLKIIHEFAHGMVCKRYGGTVREMGLLFVLGAPMAYVDVTSSWRFPSRWQRIHVAAAGMYVELAIAGLAAIVWSQATDGWLSNFCFQLIAMSGLNTVLFNANPLMKFDGYFILSDALAIPNLSVNGQQYLRYWTRKYLLGVPLVSPSWPPSQRNLIRFYGVAAFCWRILVCSSLVVMAAAMFQGAGIVLAALAVLLWVGAPCVRFFQYFIFGKPGERPRRLRFLLTVGALTGCVLAFGCLPWPGARTAPAVVEYAPHTVVRAASAGFLREIHVRSGAPVTAGQLLFVLENREQAKELADLELAVRQSEVRIRQHEQQRQVAAQQSESEHREALLAQLREKRGLAAQLDVRAPRSGTLLRRDLTSLRGTFFEVGDRLASIGDEDQKELRVSISQDDLAVFSDRVGKIVQTDLPGRSLQSVCLQRLIPRASHIPEHPALVSVNGGPLPVEPRPDEQGQGTDYELLEPQFTGIIPLDVSLSRTVHAGQLATVRYRACDQSIAAYIYYNVARWVRDRFESQTAGSDSG